MSEDSFSVLSICLKQGPLTKLGGQVKKWKPRYCKLEGGLWKYFRMTEDGKAGELLGEVALGGAKIAPIPIHVYNKQFLIGVTPFGRKRTYVFSAKDEDESSEWSRLAKHLADSSPKPDVSSVRPSVFPTASVAKEAGEEKDGEEKEFDPKASVNMKSFQYSESDSEKVSEDLSLDSDTSEEEVELKRNTNRTVSIFNVNKKCVKEGFLIKLGHNRKNWLRRFFRLDGHLLSYYAGHECTDKLGEIHLIGSVIRLHDEADFGKKYAFSITQYTGEKKKYICIASSQDDYDQWATVVKMRHRYENRPLQLKISLDEHPDIAMTLSPSEQDLQNMKVTEEGHGLKASNIDVRKSKAGIKAKVSKKKRRFCMDGFNLDLTYVTDRIIAMGFPSVGTESIYRNAMDDVKTFFKQRHDKHYFIYNLCSERKYEPDQFEDKVLWFPFDDHNCPCFQDMSFFLRELGGFLAKDPKNVAGIHCKAGKGRTGLMITAFLLYCGEWKTADEALRYYAFARTENQKGVTIPSQIRWVHYFEQYMKMSLDKGLPAAERLVITKMVFSKKFPKFDAFKLECHGYQVEAKDKIQMCKTADGGLEVTLGAQWVVLQDFHFEFMKKKTMKGMGRAFSFWLHTQFISDYHVQLQKSEIDKVAKDKHAADFTLDLYFKADLNQEGADTWPY